MMTERRLVPKRRIAGYVGDWKASKLEELSVFSKGRGYSKDDLKNSGDPLILYGRLYTKYETIINSVDTYAVKQENSVVSKGGEVVVPSSGESKEDIARASVIAKANIILGGDLNIIKTSNELDPVFLAVSISNGTLQKELIKRAQGSSVVHLYNEDLMNITLYYPHIKEQQKIGEFFKVLDEIIANQERKIAKVKALKSAYLTEMFPQEGGTVPKRRFKGFEEEWETVKLKEIADIIGGGTPSTSNEEYWDGKIDWYSPTEIGKQVYANESVKTISELGLQKSSATILPANRTILFTSRAGIGDMAILTKEGATNQGFQSLVLKNKIDIYFIYSMGYQIKKYALTNASGSTFLEVSGKTLEKMDVILPSFEEQQKIGQFFKNLDDQITTEEKKLEKLKKTKEAYLEEMFV